MLAVGIALLAAACWGVADFLAGTTSRRIAVLIVLIGQQAVGAALAGVLLVALGEGLPSGRAVALSLTAGVTGAIALGALYRALATGKMSVVAPISATGATLPVAFGIATGDELGALVACGLALTLAGVVLASRERDDADGRPASRQSIVLALIAASGMGTFYVLADGAADESALWLLVLGRSTAVVLVGAALLATRTPLRVERAADLRTVALVGVLDAGATGLLAVANTEGLVSVVSVLGSLYPVATVLLARAVLDERLRRAQLAGVVLVFGGIGAVVAGS